MNIDNIIKYGFMIIVIVLLILILLNNKKETVINNNKLVDSLIYEYKENTINNEKEKIKFHFERIVDTVNVFYMPDSLLSRYVMSRAKELLNSGQFEDTCKEPGLRDILQKNEQIINSRINSSEQPARQHPEYDSNKRNPDY